MEFSNELNCTFGAKNNPCIVYVYNDTYITYYVQSGGTIINLTYDNVSEGVNIDSVNDFDCITWSTHILSEQDLINAIEA